MLYDYILIRYGELSLKGKNRTDFTNQLHENVANQLKGFPAIKIESSRDRMSIMLNNEDPAKIIPICQRIFGIQSLSLAIKVDNDIELIKGAALFALREEKNVRTFKISTRRANKTFPLTTEEINPIVGAHLLKNTEGITVDVHKPDLDIHLDIRRSHTFITSSRYQGIGGLPVGTSGRTLLLLSGGIDSPVAGYLAMRRGVKLEVIHFHSPPYTSEGSKEKALDLVRKLSEFGHEINVHIVPFTKVQEKIHQEIPYGYSMTVMRRKMLEISEIVASRLGILSLTTGESLGQVASQTMNSMHVINAVTSYPVLRPLITMDKSEIIEISEEIDTYPISIRPFDDCCTVFVPRAPKTKPKLDKVEYYESQLDLTNEINELLSNIQVIKVSNQDQEKDLLDELF